MWSHSLRGGVSDSRCGDKVCEGVRVVTAALWSLSLTELCQLTDHWQRETGEFRTG